jgi:hypothetical protein
VLGFAALHGALPGVVGDCIRDEWHDPGIGGNTIQQTTRGLLVWRKADNWTAFTDGYQTWVNGPYGVEQRFNTERYCWEGDADTGKPLGAGYCQIRGVPTPFSADEIGHLSTIQRDCLWYMYPDGGMTLSLWVAGCAVQYRLVDAVAVYHELDALNKLGYVVEAYPGSNGGELKLAPSVAQALVDYGQSQARQGLGG